MAKRGSNKKSNRKDPVAAVDASDDLDLDGDIGDPEQGSNTPEFTGRMLVSVLDDDDDALNRAESAVQSLCGVSHGCRASDYADEDGAAQMAAEAEDAEYTVLEELGIIVVNGDSDQMSSLQTTSADDGISAEPEQWNYSYNDPDLEDYLEGLEELDEHPDDASGLGGMSGDYLRGYRDAVNRLVDGLVGAGDGDGSSGEVSAAATFRDTSAFTWGLLATGAARSRLTGQGIRVAVLDTGFDSGHPDFRGRNITRFSAIPASQPDSGPGDVNGHGTHCIGTSCGSRRSSVGRRRRYGVAVGADIVSGKVLRQGSNGGASGADAWILAGIDRAIRLQSQVISMSLGSQGPVSAAYETAGRRALRAGSLIIAAAGNDSSRNRGIIRPVSRPANARSIIAVAAVDSRIRVANFSNAGLRGNGGEVNLCGPGVAVYSSVPRPRMVATFNGTSMATPHVAGIAALVAQQTGARGVALYRELRRRARNVGPYRDFGNGLVHV